MLSRGKEGLSMDLVVRLSVASEPIVDVISSSSLDQSYVILFFFESQVMELYFVAKFGFCFWFWFCNIGFYLGAREKSFEL